ncbi:hypothetical protein V5799_000467, partial [Amblyomma americanum]
GISKALGSEIALRHSRAKLPIDVASSLQKNSARNAQQHTFAKSSRSGWNLYFLEFTTN